MPSGVYARKCKKCGGAGHMAKTCGRALLLPPSTIAGRGKCLCKKCGEFGHQAKTCGRVKPRGMEVAEKLSTIDIEEESGGAGGGAAAAAAQPAAALPENPKRVTGNEKRKESCKKVGAEKKQIGHEREKDFLKKYNPLDLDKPTEYGATSDTSICPTHSICKKLYETIKPSNLYVSNKSGNNIQITLGNIEELKYIDVNKLNNNDGDCVRNIFNKYLKKNRSSKPAGILAYKDTKNKKWIFFNTDDICGHIVKKCKWRKLESGRIKGDFDDDSKKGYSQYITYEYRKTHKSYFLGFNGNKGIKFINLLKHPEHGIRYLEDVY